MCGIVGLIARTTSGFYHGDLDKFQDLLIVDSLRGEDSTGAYCVLSNKQVKTIKIASHPAHLFACDGWHKFRAQAITSGRVIIGHNRKATQGAVVSKNAHPFVEENIILVHNGTLRSRDGVGNEEVDSHAVCKAIAKDGAEKVLSEINGAFAFVWYDTKTSKLNIIRNDERPLSLTKTNNLYIVASEDWMARGVYGRDYGKVEETTFFKPGSLYSFSLDGSFTVKEIKLKPFIPAKTYAVSDSEWEERYPPIYNTHSRRNTNVQLLTQKPTPKKYAVDIGDTVFFDISAAEMPRGKTATVKVRGKIHIDGKPIMDGVGFLSPQIDIAEVDDWVNGSVTARISSFTESNCGPSAWLNNIVLEPYIRTNNANLPTSTWEKIVKTCKCVQCNAIVFDEEARFCNTKMDDKINWTVTCPDCVMDKLESQKDKDEFQKNRDIALQDSISECEVTLSGPITDVAAANMASIH